MREVVTMQIKDYEYFTDNLKSFIQQYNEKYLVIKGQSIIGVYDSFDSAYRVTAITEQLGTFIIQHCVEEEEEPITVYPVNSLS